MKIDIISGFLGAGKTTFIKRLLQTNVKNEKVVLIENEFGEVSVDSDFLSETNIDIKELSQGCICCSLFGDFSKALNEIVEKFNPDRIIIEPSGVGKLSDIINAIAEVSLEKYLNSLVCMVDASKVKMYSKNFGEFFIDQIENANTIILSRTDLTKNDKVSESLEIIRSYNSSCTVVTTPISILTDEELFKAYEGVKDDFVKNTLKEHHHHHEEECCCEHEHHHHHEEECCCGHEHHHHHEEECCCEHEHHHHHEEECCCEHEHHHHHEEECCCEHEHHHHHEEECCCGHEHHHHHHADEIFTAIGIETAQKYDLIQIKEILTKMSEGEYGMIVRAKGIINTLDDMWYQFNLTPNEVVIESNKPILIGKICVIGSKIDELEIRKLF